MTPLEVRLAALAATQQCITYGSLARDLGLRVSALTAELEALMTVDAAKHQPLRAALCEGRLSQGLPAKGFFDKAAELGLDVTDPAAFVAATREKLFQDAR